MREEDRLKFYKKELQLLKNFNQCECSKFRKFIISLKKNIKVMVI